MKYFLIFLFTVTLQSSLAFASNRADEITVEVKAQHADWVYQLGQKVNFIIEVKRNNQLIKDVEIEVQVGLERMDPTLKSTLKLTEGTTSIDGGTLSQPGFLRCIVTTEIAGKAYRGLATAAFDPQAIQPTTSVPDDFKHFWDSLKAQAKGIPFHSEMRLIPEQSTDAVNAYEVSLQNIEGARVYGMLAVPKKEGKYPAILKVPGAGVRPYSPDTAMAERGFIVFTIGVHGIPVSMESEAYAALANGALKGYPSLHADDRDRYYFKKVYMGCLRAVDYLTTLPEYDGVNLGVSGGSQGGALTLVTAALDQRVKAIVAYFPGLCDLTGYTAGRTGGWPHTLQNPATSQATIETSKYYDVVNFAKLVTASGLYSWGFNDETCPPTSIYSAYNVIKAPKELFVIKESGHQYYPIQSKRMGTWMEAKLTGKPEKL